MNLSAFVVAAGTVASLGCSGTPRADLERAAGDPEQAAIVCAEVGEDAECDICHEHALYGDGVCDEWCEFFDPDCRDLCASNDECGEGSGCFAAPLSSGPKWCQVIECCTFGGPDCTPECPSGRRCQPYGFGIDAPGACVPFDCADGLCPEGMVCREQPCPGSEDCPFECEFVSE